MVTPFRDNGHLTAAQKKYNKYHSSTRMVIERAFGLVKGCFRRLNQGSEFIFGVGGTCATRCKFLGALPKF